MPPEYKNESAFGSPITISAPSCERMMSSIACRNSVPGAIVAIARRSLGSRRGSSSDGVRVKPRPPVMGALAACGLSVSCGIESGLDRAAERLRLEYAQFATGVRPGRNDDGADAELPTFLQAALRLCRRTQPSGEPHLAERGDAVADGDAARRRGDRERDGEIRAGLVDPYAARDV